ncbi:MAG: L,D-transpeptidase family protein, partial [Verrucomicrobiota bacterium]
MKKWVYCLTAAFLVFVSVLPASARHHSRQASSGAKKHSENSADQEKAVRLQIFLDRANFSPGQIDGLLSDFTLKALRLYRQSRGEPFAESGKKGSLPDLAGIDLAAIGPASVPYTVSEADQGVVGETAEGAVNLAKLKALPYGTLAEAVAEKFHSSPKLLERLNPGKMKKLKAGDIVQVPNVEPFDVTKVKQVKAGSEINATAANDMGDEDVAEGDRKEKEDEAKPSVSVRVDTGINMLGVFEGDKLVAAYPVSIGSEDTGTPTGEWKVTGMEKLPTFRYDEKMLKEGERSAQFYMLPPGPNSPAGVLWIALNKKG